MDVYIDEQHTSSTTTTHVISASGKRKRRYKRQDEKENIDPSTGLNVLIHLNNTPSSIEMSSASTMAPSTPLHKEKEGNLQQHQRTPLADLPLPPSSTSASTSTTRRNGQRTVLATLPPVSSIISRTKQRQTRARRDVSQLGGLRMKRDGLRSDSQAKSKKINVTALRC